MDWVNFEDELWVCFGPTKFEDCDEALTCIKQIGPLRDYQEVRQLGQEMDPKGLVGGLLLAGSSLSMLTESGCSGPEALRMLSAWPA